MPHSVPPRALRRLLPALAAAALAACGGAEARDLPSCAHPPPRVLLAQADIDPPRTGLTVDSVPVAGADPRRVWLAVKWEGPRDGALLVAECGGGVRAALQAGFTRGLRAGPSLPREPHTIVADVLTGDGAGYERWDRVLFAEDGREVRMLWSGTVRERDQSTPGRGGEETRRDAAFSRSGDTITVTGFRRRLRWAASSGDWVRADSTALAVERFCWNPGERTYRLCR